MVVRVGLDDFGTGYSSLGHLDMYTFDKVKLDRSFVEGLLHNPRSEAVARAVLQLGRTLGMAVCAEGVKTTSQLDFLRAEQCDMVQGYLTGRPGPGPLVRRA